MKRRSFFSKLAGVAVAALMAPEIIKAAVAPEKLSLKTVGLEELQPIWVVDWGKATIRCLYVPRDFYDDYMNELKAYRPQWTTKPESSG